MTRKNKHSSSGFGIPELLFILLILTFVVITGWFFYKNIQTDDGSVVDSAQQEYAIEQAKITLQNKYLNQMTKCGDGDNRTAPQRIITFHEYFKVNHSADRAIMRGCNDVDQLFAKTKDGKWFPLFTLHADRDQDNEVRKVCKIEDITTGFDDDLPENQSANSIKKDLCKDIEGTYQQYLENIREAERGGV